MFVRSSVLTLSSAAVVLMGALSLVAQESSSTKAETKAPKAKGKNDPSRRVPTHFGEVGLTTDQKESIYKIVAKHRAKIADLQKQLAAAREEEVAECETILTDTQKELLGQHRRAAAEAKAAAKKKAAEKATEEKKEPAKADAAQ